MIQIDQIKQVNISEIGLADLRSAIAVIPQDPVLFQGTIRSTSSKMTKKSPYAMLATIHRLLILTQTFPDTMLTHLMHTLTKRFGGLWNERIWRKRHSKHMTKNTFCNLFKTVSPFSLYCRWLWTQVTSWWMWNQKERTSQLGRNN